MKEGIKKEFGNVNSKEIWNNELLCAQFLRGYTQIPLLENIQPEDIEDITEVLRPFVGVEYEGDTVKQIHLRGLQGRDVYVVGLLEHKSNVDYDVTFQLLKYMVGIWTMHRNRRDKEQEGSSRHKDFRYPLIIPVVYYEGRQRWSAAMYWKDRVEFSDAFGQYVPDFTYELVELHNYSNEELLSREEELSLVMLLNRVQDEGDMDLSSWPEEQRATVEKIVRKAPKAVLRILAQMIYHFGLKLNLPDEEIIQCVRNVEDREMGELWANMEKIDIQEIRRKAEQTRQEAEQIRQKSQQEIRLMKEEIAYKDRLIEKLQSELERLQE